jgi:hypothetical protein
MSYEMSELLQDLNILVACYGGVLPLTLQAWYMEVYEKILAEGYKETGGLVLERPPEPKRRLKSQD